MRLKNIWIKNFKGIENQNFIFHQQFTVLIGDNGKGKTSILDAISIALGTILMKTGASFGYNAKTSRPLFKDEIRKITSSSENIEYTDVELSGIFEVDKKDIFWKRTQPVTSKSLSYKDAQEITQLGQIFIDSLKQEKEINLPLFVHHTTARLWTNIYDKTKKYQKIDSRLEGYYACLDSRSIKDKFFSWFRTFEDSALKFNKDKSLYKAFTNAIVSMVKDWEEIHYSWQHEDILGKTADGSWLPLKNLSDGYRSIIHLTADIAYRAIKLNPHLGEKAVLETTGIVLIDEIDMHLHPKWQKNVIEDFKKTFPNLQFIVTTHSPFIIQSLMATEIINLDGEVFEQDPFTKSIEEIAEDMNVENVQRSAKFIRYQTIAARYFSLLKEGKKTANLMDLKQELDELELEFSNDPVYVALMKAERKSFQ